MASANKLSSLSVLILLTGTLLITALIYWPGITGQFILDDYPNIVSNSDLHINDLSFPSLKTAALSMDSGILMRPVAMLSFALNYYATNLSPTSFKLFNIAIHLLNGAIIFVLSRLLLIAYQKQTLNSISQDRIVMISLAVTTLWLLHPINLTPALYVVQRMTSLSALFVFAGLACYIQGRLRQIDGKTGFHWIAIGLVIFGSLALLSKENGALLPLFMFIIEFTLFRFKTTNKYSRNNLKLFFIVTLLIPALLISMYVIHNPSWITEAYISRDFSLTERLLTQSRAIWYYLYLIIAPSNRELSLYHDDFPISHTLFDPVTTMPAILALFTLVIFAVLQHKRTPILSIGILLFAAGHLLESGFFALEIMFEHRNYFPSYGILLIIAFYSLTPKSKKLKIPGVCAIILLAIISAFITTLRADIWGDILDHAVFEAHAHPNSPRANLELAVRYSALSENIPPKEEYYFQLAKKHYLHAAQLKSNYTSSLFGLIKTACKLNRDIEQEWVDELEGRLRTEPFRIATISWLEILGDYDNGLGCSPPEEIMTLFINAALDNPNITTHTRVLLLTTSSKYYAHRIGDLDKSLYLIALAAQTDIQNPEPRVHLAILLTKMGRLEDAQFELNSAKVLDKLYRYTTQIEKQEDVIKNLLATNKTDLGMSSSL